METSRTPTCSTGSAPAPESLLDDEKTGATLMLCGVLLTLVGVIFTVMGWQHYKDNPTIQWNQLLGPILISIGGTFLFSSVCQLGVLFRIPWRYWDEESPAMEQTPARRSFTFSGISQPRTRHGAPTVLCVPPAYNFLNHEVCQFQPGTSVSCIHADGPPSGSVYCRDNTAFRSAGEEEGGGGGGSSARRSEAQHRSRSEKMEGDRGRDNDSDSICSQPPAYEDIYPSLHNQT